MRTGVLHVIIEGRLAGQLERQHGRVSFRYDDGYPDTATPLSTSMRPGVGRFTDRTVAPWIAGLLPDAEPVLERWARRFSVPNNPFSLLSSPVGEDCAGAVQFCSDERLDDLLDRHGRIEWLTDADVEQLIGELRRDRSEWLGREHAGWFSLPGAQAKRALLHLDGRWGIPHGATPTNRIVKPALAELDGHDLNEHLCLSAASVLGLPAAESRVLRFGEERALVVTRYDRRRQGGALVRVHQEDLCQASSRPPEAKYEREGGPGVSAICDLLRTRLEPDHAAIDIRRFVDALLFNTLIVGTDAHAKNYSLLLSGRQVRLAPLYDVASVLPYPKDVDWHQWRYAMKIGGAYDDAKIAWRHWERVASVARVDPDELRQRAEDLAERAPAVFARAAGELELGSHGSPVPQLLANGVAARSKHLLTVVGAA